MGASGSVPYFFLLVFCLMYGHGCGSIDNAAMTESLGAFPNHKGNVVGALKGYYGLSTASITVGYNAVFTPDQKDFLIFLGVYAAISGLLLVPVIWRCKAPVNEPTERINRKFRIIAIVLVCFMLYILVVNTEKNEISKGVWLVILASVVLGSGSLFLLPLRCSWQAEQSAIATGGSEQVMPGPIVIRDFNAA